MIFCLGKRPELVFNCLRIGLGEIIVELSRRVFITCNESLNGFQSTCLFLPKVHADLVKSGVLRRCTFDEEISHINVLSLLKFSGKHLDCIDCSADIESDAQEFDRVRVDLGEVPEPLVAGTDGYFV